MKRNDGRKANQLRPVKIQRNFLKHPEGSVLISMGDTKVICTASVQEGVPPFLRGSGKGWVTAEYQMLPRSTNTRMPREAVRGKVGGRTHEISRLIGRSLRAVTDMTKLGERSIQIDCDVIQADGGTRTASITGAMVALTDAVKLLEKQEKVGKGVLTGQLAAISVGIVAGQVLLDLDYSEDSSADVDMNVVMNGKGKFIELQSTAEKEAFGQEEMLKMVSYAKTGIKKLLQEQKKA